MNTWCTRQPHLAVICDSSCAFGCSCSAPGVALTAQPGLLPASGLPLSTGSGRRDPISRALPMTWFGVYGSVLHRTAVALLSTEAFVADIVCAFTGFDDRSLAEQRMRVAPSRELKPGRVETRHPNPLSHRNALQRTKTAFGNACVVCLHCWRHVDGVSYLLPLQGADDRVPAGESPHDDNSQSRLRAVMCRTQCAAATRDHVLPPGYGKCAQRAVTVVVMLYVCMLSSIRSHTRGYQHSQLLHPTF